MEYIYTLLGNVSATGVGVGPCGLGARGCAGARGRGWLDGAANRVRRAPDGKSAYVPGGRAGRQAHTYAPAVAPDSKRTHAPRRSRRTASAPTRPRRSRRTASAHIRPRRRARQQAHTYVPSGIVRYADTSASIVGIWTIGDRLSPSLTMLRRGGMHTATLRPQNFFLHPQDPSFTFRRGPASATAARFEPPAKENSRQQTGSPRRYSREGERTRAEREISRRALAGLPPRSDGSVAVHAGRWRSTVPAPRSPDSRFRHSALSGAQPREHYRK